MKALAARTLRSRTRRLVLGKWSEIVGCPNETQASNMSVSDKENER